MCSIITILLENKNHKFEKTFAGIYGKGLERLEKRKCCNSVPLYL